MNLLITGGRGFNDEQALNDVLDAFLAENDVELLIHGGARGADALAGEWAEKKDIPVKIFKADWATYSSQAGRIRNEQMLRYLEPEDTVIAFWDGSSPGTRHMIRIAQERGLTVIIKEY